jgi:diadenosine tetraphosphate (Ap4A) HIT family hydrolase
MDAFKVDPAFEAGSAALGRLVLCEVRLQLDARYPWLILIPARAGLVELVDLSADERVQLFDEIARADAAVRAMGAALQRPVEKMNLGALGNITRQLHVHVVGRRADDPAWPGPVWGVGAAVAYTPAERAAIEAAARNVLFS